MPAFKKRYAIIISRRLVQNPIKRRKKTPTVALSTEKYKEKRGIHKISAGPDKSFNEGKIHVLKV